MNSDDVRRRILDERARNPADFVGRSARPEQLADSLGFQPIRGRVGELQSEEFRAANRNSTKPRPLLAGSGAPIVPVGTAVASSGLQFASYNVTSWIGYTVGYGQVSAGSMVIKNIDFLSTDPPAVGDTISSQSGSIPAFTLITAVDLTLKTITINSMPTLSFPHDRLICSNSSGPVHPYPTSVDGYYQFGFNMSPGFLGRWTGDGVHDPATQSVTVNVDMVDASNGSLVNAHCTLTTHNDASSPPADIDEASGGPITVDTTKLFPPALIYGIKISMTIGSPFIGEYRGSANIISPEIQTVFL